MIPLFIFNKLNNTKSLAVILSAIEHVKIPYKRVKNKLHVLEYHKNRCFVIIRVCHTCIIFNVTHYFLFLLKMYI